MTDTQDGADELLRLAARTLKGYQRRRFQAEVCCRLCDGNPRLAERRFGWGRRNVATGIHELSTGIRCALNNAHRGARRSEDLNPQLAADIRSLVEPQTYVDPELRSCRRYSNLSAAEVLEALHTRLGYAADALPKERTMRDILNRLGYRLKRIQKGKPLRKTADTNAIFANLEQVRREFENDPETLQVSMDTKAKVAVGEYARGGKKPDGRSG